MPIAQTYSCDVCHVAVDDAALELDVTGVLRRIVLAGGSATRPVGGTPVTVEQRQYSSLVFCGYAHAGVFLAAQSF